ncbi:MULTISPECIES: hypothetical protein [unclassified Streptomyces]|uniref:hypothetical protein n=1 Tax=unclassified Streptomyces TaxID=2593676 RepID=UPI0037F2E633
MTRRLHTARRLRGTLIGLMAFATAATTLAATAPSAQAHTHTGGQVLSVPVTELKSSVLRSPGVVAPADEGPIERDEDNPWTVGECRKDADPGPGTYDGQVIRTSRYSLCTVLRTKYSYMVDGTEVAYANFRVTVLQDSHRKDRKASIHLMLDQWSFTNVSGNPAENYGRLQEADLTVTLACTGSGNASCKGHPDRESRPVAEWQRVPGADDAFAKFDMGHSKATDPAKDSRAKGFLASDGVSFHGFDVSIVGEWGASIKFSEPLRCDRAFYQPGSGGCVWNNTRLVWYVDYKDFPQYAKHLFDATEHPTATQPFGSFPGVRIPGALDTKPTPKPLTRLQKSADGNTSLTYYKENERIRTNACRKLGHTAGQECDEFPLRTTYEGANYSTLYPADTWKYSVRYIDGDDNWLAGLDWASWLARRRVLAKGDELWVLPFNIPNVVMQSGAPVTGKAAKPAIARLTQAERAAAPIPRNELCHHPVMGGSYDCDYGEEWYVYSNGVKQMWVIGSDRQVWTRWSRPDGSFVGWRPFGGQATSGLEVVLDESQGMGAVVRVRGTDGKPYYRERDPNTGAWTDWHLR